MLPIVTTETAKGAGGGRISVGFAARTAEQVAQAHLADLDMGAKFGVQFLAYWFDADQGEAFGRASEASSVPRRCPLRSP
jgi:hypothetical protein